MNLMNTMKITTPDQEERVLAALAHVAVILPFMGLIVPIYIWVSQKGKSAYVAFQALQAIAYQLSMLVAWFIGMGCYLLSFFGIFLGMPFATSLENSQTLNPVFGLAFIFPFIIFGAILAGGLLFIVYGVVGAFMALKGKPFRYWLIGRKVESYIQPKPDAGNQETLGSHDDPNHPVSK